MIRGACGSHDHPDPLLFAQVYRLITFYSLVKPPKGSNVESEEIFEMLLSNHMPEGEDDRKKQWYTILDKIIDQQLNQSRQEQQLDCHDDLINDHALEYFSGFVAKNVKNWTSCTDCLSSLVVE